VEFEPFSCSVPGEIRKVTRKVPGIMVDLWIFGFESPLAVQHG
jgi:hypothetical protein